MKNKDVTTEFNILENAEMEYVLCEAEMGLMCLYILAPCLLCPSQVGRYTAACQNSLLGNSFKCISRQKLCLL